MRNKISTWTALALLGFSPTLWPLHATEAPPLWLIGVPDHNDAELALAPSSHARFKEDGLFVVGESDAKRDWPYAHPGPNDAWAGNRPHTFTILFGLKTPPASGECRLQIALVDTHSGGPPKLAIQINGHAFERSLPRGGGDASINGEPAKGRPHEFTLPFTADLLHSGDNDIQITTTDGSWMLYDFLALSTPTGATLQPVASHTVLSRVQAIPALCEVGGESRQPINVTLRHFGEPEEAALELEGSPAHVLKLQRGEQTAELTAPTVAEEAKRKLTLKIGSRILSARDVTLKPVRKLTVYILPHSHTDIGYTEIQTDIEKKQVQNLVDGIAAAKRTADYPQGARFVWNVEVAWAADLYLRRLNQQQRADFLDAVKRGQVVLNGMYLNELTGLCRPEELVRLFRYATKLTDQTGVPIDSVMISDVPGYTWATVTTMAHAGIKYFSTAPNYFDRIGTILREWENKPFYWVGPDGKTEVLVWIPFWGYAMSHRYGEMSVKLVEDFCAGLEQRGYPYEIAHVRWSGHGDNAVPDPKICEFVKDWNAKYTTPHFVISGTGEAFRAFEQRYGTKLPRVQGDWTPYWEDGAGSSALETAMNRESSDRLEQAEALWAMLDPESYPAAAFEDAWNNVLLYSEHTWGAHCSVWGPERQETKEQWEIKRGYALAADKQSRELLIKAAAPSERTPYLNGVDVYNTASWPRTELVTLSQELSTTGDCVLDDRGKPVPSQRLTSGELAFVAHDVPALGAKRFTVNARQSRVDKPAVAYGVTLDNGRLHAVLDVRTGAITELTAKGIDGDFADTSSGRGLNEYLYLIADDLKDLQRNGPVNIRVGEPGPLVASLIAESTAAGCRKLTREVRAVAGMDYVELINDVDKERAPKPANGDYREHSAKESVNFAFEFNVPDGEMHLDLPLGVMRPEADQMPSACKNWFTVGRWADVANRDRGIQWVTLDAPLVEVGEISARFLNSQYDPDTWRRNVAPTQRLYSWAMNNHWGTNYRAYQEGNTRFRFILRPYRKSDPAENSRFATAFSQPLIALPARGEKPPSAPLLTLGNDDVLITGLKPSDDGKAVIIRLFGASGETESVRLKWGALKPQAVFLSDTSEKPGVKAGNRVTVPRYGLVTLRAELN